MNSGNYLDHPWLPLLLVAIALGGLQLSMVPELRRNYQDAAFQKRFAEQQKLTETEAANQIEKMSRAAPYLSVLEAPIVISAGAAGVAIALLLIGRFRFKQRVPFPMYFSMVAWASFVSCAPLVLNLIVRLIRPSLNPIPTNASVLLPASMNGTYLYNVLLALDLFLVWQVWLLGLGLAVLCGVSRQRAIASVGTLFIVLAVMNAAALTLSNS